MFTQLIPHCDEYVVSIYLRVFFFFPQLFIDWLARAMCMRDELVPDDYDKRIASEDAIRAANATLSHYSASNHEGGKQRKRKNKPKPPPEMKYNKFQMYDMASDGSTSFRNHSRAEATSPDKSPIHVHQSVESDVKEIRRYLRQLLARIHQKEEKNKIALEWRIVALVMDRLFFFLYLAAIIISLVTIFPKTYW